MGSILKKNNITEKCARMTNSFHFQSLHAIKMNKLDFLLKRITHFKAFYDRRSCCCCCFLHGQILKLNFSFQFNFTFSCERWIET